MNKVKRIIATFMTCIMCMMCVIPASAAGVDDLPTATPVESTLVVDKDNSGVDSATSTNDLQALTDVLTVQNITTGQEVSGSFISKIDDYRNITIVIQGEAACTVTVTGLIFGHSESKYIPAGGGTYTICNGKGNFNYTIRFHSSAPAAAYQFFATDNYYG